ncbi:alpha/beta fold hydrolase [Nonomuraea sp. C10]|uniref:alpha/beta fold hydrolase n=1 Tax=Nonomuraea sp. C10 TaxID=2600577 RepID=UPI001650A8C6|nr:alpha/beta hydrolase [Nonomuraea sp. C10]
MSTVTLTGTAVSADGTAIAYDRHGSGPAVVLVHGAFAGRGHPTLAGVAAGLAPWFTVYEYDRRGRGGSGDTSPYAVEREIEDLAAVVGAAGGRAMVFGGSSGGALALEAAARLPEVTKLAVWEPPYHVTADAPVLPHDFAARLDALVREGRRGDAAELFMVAAAEVPREAVALMRADPSWPEVEAVAHTLAYEAAVMGPGNALPAARLAEVTQPALVMNGDAGPAWMAAAARAVAGRVPGAVHRVLEGQAHAVAPEALLPELLEFFVVA